jgi:hypothetical protein
MRDRGVGKMMGVSGSLAGRVGAATKENVSGSSKMNSGRSESILASSCSASVGSSSMFRGLLSNLCPRFARLAAAFLALFANSVS